MWLSYPQVLAVTWGESLGREMAGLGAQDVAPGYSCSPEGLRVPTLGLVPGPADPSCPPAWTEGSQLLCSTGMTPGSIAQPLCTQGHSISVSQRLKPRVRPELGHLLTDSLYPPCPSFLLRPWCCGHLQVEQVWFRSHCPVLSLAERGGSKAFWRVLRGALGGSPGTHVGPSRGAQGHCFRLPASSSLSAGWPQFTHL